MRAKLAKTEWRRNLSQQRDDIEMLDPTLGVRIVFAPESDELVEVMWTENRPIAGQIIKVVHDNSHKQVDDLSW